jgi:hypothetical protein
MTIPIISNEGNINKENSNLFFNNLMNRNSYLNESQIIEKNSKKFYYEMECMILDIKRLSK